MKPKIPKSFVVQPLKPGEVAGDRVECGDCGLAWDDGKVTGITPTPAGRCPFEAWHKRARPKIHPVTVLLSGLEDCVNPRKGWTARHERARLLLEAAPKLLAVARKVEECRDDGWDSGAMIEELQDMARAALHKLGGCR